MKKNWTLALLLMCNFLFGQSDVDVASSSIINNTNGYWMVNKNTIASDVKGSYLLFDDYNNSGIITTSPNKKYSVSNLNYNIKQDQIEAKTSKDSIFIFYPQVIEMVEINKKLLRRFIDSELYENGYYEIIATSKEKELLKRYEVTIREGNFNPMTLQKLSKDRYVITSKYFIHAQNIMVEISLKKSKFLKIFEKDSDIIKKFLSDNNLSLKDDNDLKKIFNYYDSL